MWWSAVALALLASCCTASVKKSDPNGTVPAVETTSPMNAPPATTDKPNTTLSTASSVAPTPNNSNLNAVQNAKLQIILPDDAERKNKR